MNNYVLTFLAFFGLFTKQPPYYKFENEIIEQQRKEILQPMGLNYSVIGGENDDGVKIVHLGVSTKGPGSIVEGRKLIVYLVEDLLRRYNTHQKIRPFLSNYPYITNNIIYTIWYNAPGGFWVLQENEHPEKEIAHITMYRGKIDYNVNLTNAKIVPLKTIYTESYEDAKRIVMHENNKNETESKK